MSRRQNDPLRPLTPNERNTLTRLSRSLSAPAAQVERARALLAIADGATYTAAAHQVGRRHTETISAWVSRFNRDGLAAVRPGHGGGARIRYGGDAQQRILAEWARTPEREQDGTATWSLSLRQKAVRQADDGLPQVSTYTIWRTLHAGGLSLAEEPHLVPDRGGHAPAQAGHGHPRRSGCGGKKGLIEQAYTLGAQLGLSVWYADEAGPFQAVPHPGVSWQPREHPAQQPHEDIRGGTTPCRIPGYPGSRANTRPSNRTKTSAAAQPRAASRGILAAARTPGPATARIHPRRHNQDPDPVSSGSGPGAAAPAGPRHQRSPAPVLPPWLRERLSDILAGLPVPQASLDPAATQAAWAVWQGGPTRPFNPPNELPPPQPVLVGGNPGWHK